MAFIGLTVPSATSRLFSEVEVPGDKTPRDRHHVTLIYIGDDVPIDTLAEAIKATYAVTSQTQPFTARTSRVGTFPVSDDQEDHPVIAYVESDELHVLRAGLVDRLTEAGVDFDRKYPKYRPHVTLSYAPTAVEEFRIPTIEWGAHEIVLWGGDEGDQKLTATFPFALHHTMTAALEREMARRVAHRFTLGTESARYGASATSR